MTLCNCKCSCSLFSGIASVIIGIIGAFLQITGALTLAPVFLWATAGVALVYLGVLLLASALQQQCSRCSCTCTALNGALAGALGTILLAVILLVVAIAATSVIVAVLTGLLLLFFSLLITETVCLIRNLYNCGN